MANKKEISVSANIELSAKSVLKRSLFLWRDSFTTFAVPMILTYVLFFMAFESESWLPVIIQTVGIHSLPWIFSGILSHGVFQKFLGQNCNFGDCFAASRSRLGSLVVTSLTIGLLAGTVNGLATSGSDLAWLGSILSLPMMIVVCGCFVAGVVSVVERRDALSSLRRSWTLTTDYKFKIFQVSIILVLVLLPLGALLLYFVFLSGGNFVAVVALLVVQGVVSSFVSLAMVIIYHDLRVLVEGSSVNELAMAIEARHPSHENPQPPDAQHEA